MLRDLRPSRICCQVLSGLRLHAVALKKGKAVYLYDKAIAGKEGSRQRVEHIVKGVVPGHNRPHNAHWVILHSSRFVEHLWRPDTEVRLLVSFLYVLKNTLQGQVELY